MQLLAGADDVGPTIGPDRAAGADDLARFSALASLRHEHRDVHPATSRLPLEEFEERRWIRALWRHQPVDPLPLHLLQPHHRRLDIGKLRLLKRCRILVDLIEHRTDGIAGLLGFA